MIEVLSNTYSRALTHTILDLGNDRVLAKEVHHPTRATSRKTAQAMSVPFRIVTRDERRHGKGERKGAAD